MDHDLVLCVSLAPMGAAEIRGSTPAPVVIDRGDLPDDAVPGNAVLVHESDFGWMALDRATDEVKPLHEQTWSDLGGWRLKLASPDDDLDLSIHDHSGVVAQELQVRPGPSSLARAERIRLPAEEGASRVIGRGETADHVIADKKVSREQLRVTIRDGRAWIEDMGSAWGTTVNGVKAERETALRTGDEIEIGDTVLAFIDPLESLRGRFTKSAASLGGDEPDPRQSPRRRRRLPNMSSLKRVLRVARPSTEMTVAIVMIIAVFGVLVWVAASLYTQLTDTPVGAALEVVEAAAEGSK